MAISGNQIPTSQHFRDEWLRILKEISEIDLKTAVPGHGAVGTPEDFITNVRYIEALYRRAQS